MAITFRRSAVTGLVLAAVTAVGCNMSSVAYFLFGPEDRQPPFCHELDAPKKEIKLLILANVGTEMRPEFLRADRELAERLVQHLRKVYKDDKAKITIVSPAQVDNYKDQNPDWQTKGLRDIGDHFHADYVTNIDMDKLDLYEPRSLKELLRCQAQVAVTVFDMARPPHEGRVFEKEFTFLFPQMAPKSVLENPNIAEFRAAFLTYMVKELSRCFGPFSNDDKYACNE